MEIEDNENLLCRSVKSQVGDASQPFEMIAIGEPLGHLLQRRIFDFVGKRVEKHADKSCRMLRADLAPLC